MKHRRLTRLTAALAAGALFVTACGADEEAADTDDPDTDDVTDDVEDDAAEDDDADVDDDADAADDDAAADGESYELAFLPKATANPVFDTANIGAQDAGDELGHTVEYVGPSDAEVAQQVEWTENLTTQGVDAIMISAIDPEGNAAALREAMDQGITTVSWDSDVSEDARSVYASPPDFPEIGQILAEMLGEQIDYSGEYAWLSTGPEVFNQNTWIEEAEAYMEDNPDEYGDMENVRVAYGEDDDALSYSEAEGLLSAFPDLEGIVSPTTVGIAAAARAVQDAGMCGEVAVTGLGTPNEMRSYVEDGCSEAFALWSFEDLGYLTVYATDALLQGEISGEEGETFEAGRLGEYEIQEGGAVPLAEPLVFDESNIDDFDF